MKSSYILFQKSKGKRDCRLGINPVQKNKHYLDGYSRQYESEAKASANSAF